MDEKSKHFSNLGLNRLKNHPFMIHGQGGGATDKK